MDDLKNMYIKVAGYDVILLVLFVIVFSIINFDFIIPCALGIIVALANLIFSGIASSNALLKNKVGASTYFSFVMKVIVSGVVGALLISLNIYYIIPFVIGYISNFISLILYGLTLKE